MDQAHWTSVPVTEFHNINWTKNERSPILTKIASFSDNLVYKFAHEIKTAYNKSLKKGLEALQALIDLGMQLHQYQNFNSLILIHLTIHLQPISLLTKLWVLLPKRYHSHVETISALFHTSKNFSQYRSAISSSSGSFIHCREVVLQDLLFLTEAQPDFDQEMINCTKLLVMGDIIFNCKTSFSDRFPPNPSIATELDLVYDSPPAHFSQLLGTLTETVGTPTITPSLGITLAPPSDSLSKMLAPPPDALSKRRSKSVPEKIADTKITETKSA